VTDISVLHIPYAFFPDPVGGTEVYVGDLARTLKSHGVNSIIAAPGASSSAYEWEGLPVYRYAVQDIGDPHELYALDDSRPAAEVASILDAERPDILHMHSLTRANANGVVQAAKQRAIPTVFTYHTPTVTCQRGTLMRWGSTACDGKMRRRTCTACTLQSHGVPRPVADILALSHPLIGNVLHGSQKSGGPWTALRLRREIESRHQATRALLESVDLITVFAAWTSRVLEINNVPRTKIRRTRHGIDASGMSVRDRPSPRTGTHFVWAGRTQRVKGLDVIIRAVTSLPESDLSLDVYPVVQGESDRLYFEECRNLLGGDDRIRIREPFPPDRAAATFAAYDALLVPSRWFETGPLVILQAFAGGIPVIATDLGGMKELVTHNRNGLLVPDDSTHAWASVIQRACSDRMVLDRLRPQIDPPPSRVEAALDVLDVYRELAP
jgi:glycosyltransferase involved in cell wall biosynthesis